MKFNKLFYEPYKDMFGYYKEIQQINKNYRLYLNKQTNFIEIINIDRNYEICYRFNSISKIKLQDLRFYRVENCNEIFKTIDEHNKKIESNLQSKQNTISKSSFKEFIKLQHRFSSINKNDINKIIGATQC